MQLDTSTTITVSGQEIPVVYIAIALPVLALLYTGMQLFGGDMPLMGETGRLTAVEGREANLANLEAEAQELKRQAAAVDETKEEISKREEQITLLKQQIPSDAQVSVLLYDIERMTRQSQSSLFSFTPGSLRAFGGGEPGAATSGGAATADIQELPVTIKATATYPEVIDFLGLLNNYERKLNVSNLSLTPAGNASVQQAGPEGKPAPGFKNTLNVEFTLLAYVLKSNGAQP